MNKCIYTLCLTIFFAVQQSYAQLQCDTQSVPTKELGAAPIQIKPGLYEDIRSFEIIKEFLERLAERQENFQTLRKEIDRLKNALDKAKSEQDFAIKRDAQLKEQTDRSERLYEHACFLQGEVGNAQRQLEATQKKLTIFQLIAGASIGGLLGLCVHAAACMIAKEIDGLDEESAEEKRNLIITLLTNKVFKPLMLITACLCTYGVTKV